VARFIVPVEPAVTLKAPPMTAALGEAEPYGRRVVHGMMAALFQIHEVRSRGELDPLLAAEGPAGNANFLAALAGLEPAVSGGALDISVSWSRERPAPVQAVTRVVFSSDALRGLGGVAAALRDRADTKGFELTGYVTHLARGSGGAEAAGEVVIVTSRDVADLGRVLVQLDADSYLAAIDAHRDGSEVRVLGTLGKVGRRWRLTEATGFELWEPGHELGRDGGDS
jgi:hypothetical protein